MNIPTVNTLDISGKIVLLRADLDISFEGNMDKGNKRLEVLLPTINLLFEKGAKKVLLMGHRGRPDGRPDTEFSLKPLIDYFKSHFAQDTSFIDFVQKSEIKQLMNVLAESESRLVILENLRFWKEEEENDPSFANDLASLGEVYVNEAFASSHRNHASIVGLPQKMKEKYSGSVAIGLRFEEELKNLSRITENPERPLLSIISGLKKDKLDYIESFKQFSDIVLVAGRLPEFLPEDYRDPRVLVAKLNPDKEDITIHSIEKFEDIILSAKTIVLGGPIGKYEDMGHRLGTKRVFNAIATSAAFKVAGGGDTEQAIEILNLTKSFDWISVGGGAMLDFISQKTLPGIQAILADFK